MPAASSAVLHESGLVPLVEVAQVEGLGDALDEAGRGDAGDDQVVLEQLVKALIFFLDALGDADETVDLPGRMEHLRDLEASSLTCPLMCQVHPVQILL